MPINQPALEKLRAATFNSENFIETMLQMVNIQEMMGASGDTQLPLDYQEPGMKVEPGELIPFIIIGLRKVPDVEQVVKETEVIE